MIIVADAGAVGSSSTDLRILAESLPIYISRSESTIKLQLTGNEHELNTKTEQETNAIKQ